MKARILLLLLAVIVMPRTQADCNTELSGGGPAQLIQIANFIRERRSDRRAVRTRDAAAILNWQQRSLARSYHLAQEINWEDPNQVFMDEGYKMAFGRWGMGKGVLPQNRENNAHREERLWVRAEFLRLLRQLYADTETAQTKNEINLDWLNLLSRKALFADDFLRGRYSTATGRRINSFSLMSFFAVSRKGVETSSFKSRSLMVSYPGKLSVDELIELFPYAIYPGGLTDDPVDYDGIIQGTPLNFFLHDEVHADQIDEEERFDLPARLELHHRFKTLVEGLTDRRQAQIVKLIWFEAFHEDSIHYELSRLKVYLADFRAGSLLNKLNKKAHYENEFPDLFQTTTLEEILAAKEILRATL